MVCYLGYKQRAKAGAEPGELGVLRTKLLTFLRQSQHYVAAEHISSFPQDGEGGERGREEIYRQITYILPSLPLSLTHSLDLFEERALFLSRLGRHEVALAIYAHVLKEPDMAEE